MGNELVQRAKAAATGGNGNGNGDQPQTLDDKIRRMKDEFKLAMPKGLEATQLIRDALTCLRTTPKLRECEPNTVLGGLMTCAQLGLRPGVAALGHAWLLPFWDNRSRTQKAQLIVGYQGYRELAQRSGTIATLVGRTVYEFDEFDIDYGLADNLVHKPRLDGDRGEPVGYYSIVKYTAGGYAFWHMSRSEVEQHRDRYAMARNRKGEIVGPWRDNFDEMAVKTTFRQLARWMPKTPELAYAIQADDSVRYDYSNDESAMDSVEHPVIDAEIEEDDTTATVEQSEPDTRTEEEKAIDAAREAETGGQQA